jgi:hypothetical protein
MKREMMNTIKRELRMTSRYFQFELISFAIAMLCVTSVAYSGPAQQSAQQTFPSAAEASQNLCQAVQNNNVQAIANILGGPTDLASSGDEAQDNAERELFIEKYKEMHRLGRDGDGTVTLYIGAENWPFPIPLVEKNGAWRFDPDAGAKEVLFRRIGENELTAIMICHEFVAAEVEYRAEPNTTNPASSFPTSLVAQAAGVSPRQDPVLLHGYYFRVLPKGTTNGTRTAAQGKSAGRFALIAYPAEYRSSGVMTFIITGDDVVYNKDLGANTAALASALRTFPKDATWHAAAE